MNTFNEPPYPLGQVMIRQPDYKTITLDRYDYRSGSWYYLVNFGDERIWLAASTIRNLGYVPIEKTRS